jgi:hypothetical protein
LYPSLFINSAQALAVRVSVEPVLCGLSENPNPGSEGTITWKASLALPPWAMGAVSGPITFENLRTEPGQSRVSISGNARSSCRNTPLT